MNTILGETCPICPFCERPFKSITPGHLRKCVGITLKEFKDKYPNFELYSTEVKSKIKQGAEKGAKSLHERRSTDPEFNEKYLSRLYGDLNPMRTHANARKAASDRLNLLWFTKRDMMLKASRPKESEDLHGNVFQSGLEKIVGTYLERLDIFYITQKWFVQNNIFRRADFVIQSQNVIVEVFGDYWHCNPKTWGADDIHPTFKVQARDVWDYDLVSLSLYRDKGYQTVVLWESEIKDGSFTEKLDSVIHSMNEYNPA
jgi:G:T-mismatch repair DNA endonuclease (very short patch repair protein)